MSTAVEAAEATARDPEPAGQRPRARRILAAVAGPALIVACVLFALRGFAFTPHLTNDHFDILSFWLPRFTFLARSLDAGHVPLWNPYEMMGYRFAADPQSGWLYVPAMLLFTLLSPGAAMRALIVEDDGTLAPWVELRPKLVFLHRVTLGDRRDFARLGRGMFRA